MLNKFCSVVLVMVAANAFGQQSANLPVDDDSKLITYKKVVDLPGTTKTDLYNRAWMWAHSFYKNPGDVIREKDSVAGKMICKARFKIKNQPDKKTQVQTDAGDVQYTLTLDFKEGKYRYTLSNIGWQTKSAFPAEKWMDKTSQSYTPDWDFYLQQTSENAKSILASLEKGMATPPKVKKDDW